MIGGLQSLAMTREEQDLLNPAFVAALLHRAIGGYEREAKQGMPYSLAFLVAPVVLVKATRDALPRRVDKSLAAWIQEHAEDHVQFAEIAAACVPVVRRGLLLGTSKGVLVLGAGYIEARPLPRGAAAAIARNTQDFRDVMDRANFVGRWYASAGSLQTVMALWGVCP